MKNNNTNKQFQLVHKSSIIIWTLIVIGIAYIYVQAFCATYNVM